MASVYFFSKRDLDLSISSSFLKKKKKPYLTYVRSYLIRLFIYILPYLYIETDSASLQGDIIVVNT